MREARFIKGRHLIDCVAYPFASRLARRTISEPRPLHARAASGLRGLRLNPASADLTCGGPSHRQAAAQPLLRRYSFEHIPYWEREERRRPANLDQHPDLHVEPRHHHHCIAITESFEELRRA